MANSLNKITTKSILDATVATADIADDAVTLAKMAAGTDGQIITYDASGNPTAVGPGTDGQVLTSTGAGSPPAFEALPTQISLANDANNRIITGTGSGLNGEANLTYDGTHLTVGTSTSNTSDALTVYDPGSAFMSIRSDAEADGNSQVLDFGVGTGDRGSGNLTGTIEADIHSQSGGTLKSDLVLFTNGGNSISERVRIKDTGNVEIKDGDLVIGTAGHGIDFSATGNESGMASERLDSYEEGTFTPTLSNGPSISSESGRYIRIGKVVHVFWAFTAASDGPSGHCNMNMPFTLTSTAPACGGTAWDYRTKEVFAHVSAGTSKLYFYDVDASWLAGSSALIEGEVFRGCTTYEVA